MGTYLNPGSEKFSMMLNSAIYVDKTAMLAELNKLVRTAQRYLCVSRPRRFGKSVATDMLCAYYGKDADCRALFEGRTISTCDDWDRYLGQFDVVYLNIADCLAESADAKDMVEYITEEVTKEIAAKYPQCILDKRSSLRSVMNDVYNKYGSQFVVIIDEWDVIFREFKDDLSGQKEYLGFLRNWLKDKSYIAMAYMTGILPIKKYGQHSALNMFDEYSMLSPMQLAPYTGFTEEEVQRLCQEYGVDFSRIKEWYDGYIVTSAVPVAGFLASKSPGMVRQPARAYHLYSPLSVVKAVSTGHIRNYWNKTETYEALAEYIRMDFDGLKETVAELMDGRHIHVNLGTYKNDMTSFQYKDDILALLIHLGYLGYDEAKEEVFIPNREILDEYKNSTLSPEWSTTFKTLQNSQRLLEATWACDEETVAELIEAAHDKTANHSYNSEAALSYAIQLAYYKAQDEYTLIPEMDSGKGYADLVFIPKSPTRPALLVELKYNENADSALEQIRRNRYPSRLELYKGNIIAVGISYNRNQSSDAPGFKHHSCHIFKC